VKSYEGPKASKIEPSIEATYIMAQSKSKECPETLLGVDTAAVKTLQPSKNDVASA
jgi:hypothetical protein